jgi:hypothetical protein
VLLLTLLDPRAPGFVVVDDPAAVAGVAVLELGEVLAAVGGGGFDVVSSLMLNSLLYAGPSAFQCKKIL